METFFGFDEESVDSETLSETSYNTDRTDRTPATPEEDLDEVSKLHMLGTNLPLGQGRSLSGGQSCHATGPQSKESWSLLPRGHPMSIFLRADLL